MAGARLKPTLASDLIPTRRRPPAACVPLELGSAAFSPTSAASESLPHLLESSAPSLRADHCCIEGEVLAVLFDFDGTLTATPGDRSERKYKISELKERSSFLLPWLQGLRDAGKTLGIISKSSEDTILTALTKSNLRELFDGPIVARAVGFEGKAGFVEALCQPQGALANCGLKGPEQVLLVDDDVGELTNGRDWGIQTYPAPREGGLQLDDFCAMFDALQIAHPALPPDSEDIDRLWTQGLSASTTNLPSHPSQIEYASGERPRFSSFYSRHEGEANVLGQGSFGVCVLATHNASRQRCAVKVMRKEVVGRHYLEAFVKQDLSYFLLKIAREEPHPNVVNHIDYMTSPTSVFCVMDLLEGPDLDTYLRQFAPICDSFAQRSGRQVLSALDHLHHVAGVGVIHRDVKLQNLRFRSADPVSDLVLVDFGLSCLATPYQKRGIVGTSLYMAPELISGYYSTMVDVWSAGVLFYVILTGRPPWWQADPATFCPRKNVVSGKAVEEALACAVSSGISPDACDFLKGLLVVDPALRQSADEASKAIWLSSGTQDITNIINVAKSTYDELHEYTAQAPVAKLGTITIPASPVNGPDVNLNTSPLSQPCTTCSRSLSSHGSQASAGSSRDDDDEDEDEMEEDDHEVVLLDRPGRGSGGRRTFPARAAVEVEEEDENEDEDDLFQLQLPPPRSQRKQAWAEEPPAIEIPQQ